MRGIDNRRRSKFRFGINSEMYVAGKVLGEDHGQPGVLDL